MENANDQFLAYICDRTQKITEALYRVTDLLSDKEPLKWELRNKAVFIFTSLISLKDKYFLEKNSCLVKVENSINEILPLFCLFLENRTVASVNFEILKTEYESIKAKIGLERNKPESGILGLNEKKQIEPEISIGQQSIGQSIGQYKRPEKQDKKERKDKILDIIKERQEVTIGELVPHFSDCSEKTLQRDLLKMVDQRLLRKEGDKRWRKYCLFS